MTRSIKRRQHHASVLLWLFCLPCLVLFAPRPASSQLIQNGDMELAGGGPEKIPGWNIYRWEGDGQVVHVTGTAFSGQRAALIGGSGPGKIAIFQFVTLPACSYLTADPERIRKWGDELRGLTGYKIGIVWQGNPGFQDDHFLRLEVNFVLFQGLGWRP